MRFLTRSKHYTFCLMCGVKIIPGSIIQIQRGKHQGMRCLSCYVSSPKNFIRGKSKSYSKSYRIFCDLPSSMKTFKKDEGVNV